MEVMCVRGFPPAAIDVARKGAYFAPCAIAAGGNPRSHAPQRSAPCAHEKTPTIGSRRGIGVSYTSRAALRATPSVPRARCAAPWYSHIIASLNRLLSIRPIPAVASVTTAAGQSFPRASPRAHRPQARPGVLLRDDGTPAVVAIRFRVEGRGFPMPDSGACRDTIIIASVRPVTTTIVPFGWDDPMAPRGCRAPEFDAAGPILNNEPGICARKPPRADPHEYRRVEQEGEAPARSVRPGPSSTIGST